MFWLPFTETEINLDIINSSGNGTVTNIQKYIYSVETPEIVDKAAQGPFRIPVWESLDPLKVTAEVSPAIVWW